MLFFFPFLVIHYRCAMHIVHAPIQLPLIRKEAEETTSSGKQSKVVMFYGGRLHLVLVNITRFTYFLNFTIPTLLCLHFLASTSTNPKLLTCWMFTSSIRTNPIIPIPFLFFFSSSLHHLHLCTTPDVDRKKRQQQLCRAIPLKILGFFMKTENF